MDRQGETQEQAEARKAEAARRKAEARDAQPPTNLPTPGKRELRQG